VGTFRPQRFSRKKNNVRQNWFNGKEGVAEDGADTGIPTPHYNALVLSDMFLEQHLHHLYKCITDFPGMKDAVALIKVWRISANLIRVWHFLFPFYTLSCKIL